jgi:cell division protein FtsB
LRAIAAGATAAVLENKKLKAENEKLSNTNKLTVADLSYIKKRARKAEDRIGAN